MLVTKRKEIDFKTASEYASIRKSVDIKFRVKGAKSIFIKKSSYLSPSFTIKF